MKLSVFRLYIASISLCVFFKPFAFAQSELPKPKLCSHQSKPKRSSIAAKWCQTPNILLVGFLKSRKLYLCDDQNKPREFDIAIGSAGVDKRKEGDKKTPLGQYKLGEPFVSVNYGYFVPIQFPTEEQLKNGITGSAIGIHGPRREFRCSGGMNTLFNWTKGCVAVESDFEIYEIASLVKGKIEAEIILLSR